MSLRQRMSSIEPPRAGDQETTSELQVEALRELLAATGTARARAATLPCADEVADEEACGAAHELCDEEDVTVLRQRVSPPPRSNALAKTLSMDAKLDATVDESGPRPLSPMIPPPPPAPPRPVLTSVPCFEGEPEEETLFEGVRSAPSSPPPPADLDPLADTVAPGNSYIRKSQQTPRDTSAPDVAPCDAPATPQPFRPGGALFAGGVVTRGSEPPRFEAPQLPASYAPSPSYPPSPSYAPSPSYPPSLESQPRLASVPPPPVSTRAERTGRLALAACLFVVAFAGGAAVARATTAGADLPQRVWASVRAHV
jgi:hypothetical protein